MLSNKIFIHAIVGSILILPRIKIHFISEGLAIWLAVIVGALFVMCNLSGIWVRRVSFKGIILDLGFFYILSMFSLFGLFWASITLNYAITFRDILIYGYYLVYIMFLLIGFYMGSIEHETDIIFVKALIIWGFIAIVFGYLIYFNWPDGLLDFVIKVWGEPSGLSNFVTGSRTRRFTSVFGNSNYYSVFVVIFIYSVILYRKKLNLGKFYYILVALAGVSLLLSGSRMGQTSFLIIGIYLMWVFKREFIVWMAPFKLQVFTIIFSFLSVLGLAILLDILGLTNVPYYISRLGFEDGSYFETFYYRLYGHWPKFINYIEISPLWGFGPIKGEFGRIFMADSSYILLALQTGLFGLALFVGYKIYKIIIFTKILKQNNELKNSAQLSLVAALVFLLADVTAEFFYHHGLMIFIYFLWGIFHGKYLHYNNTKSIKEGSSKIA